MVRSSDVTAIETLHRRFRARVSLGLSLARAYRFVVELEPFVGDGPDPFVEVGMVFKGWRRALRDGDEEKALDAVEHSWALLEACRQRVISRDAAIEAYRVRWACENAPLGDRTIDSLARFYRLLPFSLTSQSKYEYTLTRQLAGPIGPDRRIAPTEVLEDAVTALERSWAASPLTVEESEVASALRTLRTFGEEAAAQTDAASFTASALLRRFSSFKVSIGPLLFTPRVSVAVVETNVRVLNSWNQLLADAGGQPLRGSSAARTVRRPGARLPPETLSPEDAAAPLAALLGVAPSTASTQAGPAVVPTREPLPDAAIPVRPNLPTGEIDISGLELVRTMRQRHAAEKPSAPPAVPPAPDANDRLEAVPDAPRPVETAADAPTPPIARPDLRTGEVDLSGLEFVRRRRARVDADAPTEENTGRGETPVPPADVESRLEAGVSAPAEAKEEAEPLRPPHDAEQLPSVRAFELGKLEENAAIIDRYLTGPRSPEVWQLDLDVFLGRSHVGVLNSESNAAERRRALELILNSDDLICARADQDEGPSAEHRAQVRSVATGMLMLRTSLRKSADLAQGNAAELEPLLYVADHLLWERLRLEASLKRRPSRPPRHLLLPRTNHAAAAALQRTTTLRRQRRILVRVVGVAAAVTTLVAFLGSSIPREIIDPEVRLVQVSGLPGAALFDDARMFRTTLFVSVSRTWTLLSPDERRSIVRGLGAFAAERGMDTVSVLGPKGEPWATFKEDEALLDGDLTAADMAKR